MYMSIKRLYPLLLQYLSYSYNNILSFNLFFFVLNKFVFFYYYYYYYYYYLIAFYDINI